MQSDHRVKVLLIEDDEVFRIGLTVALRQSPDLELTGVYPDGESALIAIEAPSNGAGPVLPDVILMDLGLPLLNGMATTRAIKTKYPGIRVLALTSHSDARHVDEMMRAGADGFCLKGISTERLILLIREVNQGTFWVDAGVADQFKSRLLWSGDGNDGSLSVERPASFGKRRLAMHLLDSLTERETEILALVAEGRKNAEIADLLCISSGTVRVHIHSILHKLNVRDRTEAALFVWQKNSETLAPG